MRRMMVAVVILATTFLFTSCGSEMDEAKAREDFLANAETRVMATYEVNEWGQCNDSVRYIIVGGEIPEYGSMLLVDGDCVEVKSVEGAERLEIVEDFMAENGAETTTSDLYDSSDDLQAQDYLPGYGWVHYILYVNEPS